MSGLTFLLFVSVNKSNLCSYIQTNISKDLITSQVSVNSRGKICCAWANWTCALCINANPNNMNITHCSWLNKFVALMQHINTVSKFVHLWYFFFYVLFLYLNPYQTYFFPPLFYCFYLWCCFKFSLCSIYN